MHLISVLAVDLIFIFVADCLQGLLFTAVISSEVFDHCKLYTLITINCLLYAEA